MYNKFEYKIPENADGTNPTPGDCVWIDPYGNIDGRFDNFNFKAGKTYTT